MFEAVLAALADHGFTPTAIVTRLTYLSAPDSVQGALAAGLLGGGLAVPRRHRGHRPRSCTTCLTARRRCPTDDAGWDALALETVRAQRAAGRFVPGLGHHVHKDGDPRTPRLMQIAREEGRFGPHLQLFAAIGRVHPQVLGRTLPLNGAGVCGAALADLGLPLPLLRGFALLARTAGLIGQLAEELRQPGRRTRSSCRSTATTGRCRPSPWTPERTADARRRSSRRRARRAVLRERPDAEPGRRRGARRRVGGADRPAGPAVRLAAPRTSGCRPMPYVPGVQGVGLVLDGRPTCRRARRSGSRRRPGWGRATAACARSPAVPEHDVVALPPGADPVLVAALGLSAVAALDGADLARRAGGGGAGAGAGRRRRGRAGRGAARPVRRRRAGRRRGARSARPGSGRSSSARTSSSRWTTPTTSPSSPSGWRADGPVDLVVDPLFGVPAAAAAARAAPARPPGQPGQLRRRRPPRSTRRRCAAARCGCSATPTTS